VELILREAVAACPSQPGAHYDYGLFLLNQGRPAEALPAFQQAVALAPNWAPPYLGMAETAVRTGQNDAASVALSRALRLDPANREALWGIATLHDLQRHSFQETVQAYHTFLSQYPDDPRADRAKERIRALQSQFRPAPRQDRVTLFGPPRATAAPVVPETLAAPQPLQAEAPEELPVRRPRVRNREAAVAAYNRGTLYQARNDWNRAIDFYIQSLESDDSFSLAYYNLGVAYHSLGSLGLAQQAYEASIGLQPCHVNSRFNLAVLYRETGRTEEAADQLQAALRCDSTHARTHYMLGLIYADSSRTFDLAERHFRRFLRLAPNDAAAVDVRAWLQRPMP
jgi:Tfp pilus assembly protein PilF